MKLTIIKRKDGSLLIIASVRPGMLSKQELDIMLDKLKAVSLPSDGVVVVVADEMEVIGFGFDAKEVE